MVTSKNQILYLCMLLGIKTTELFSLLLPCLVGGEKR